MFNKKDFINWNNQAINTNPEMQDYCSSRHNPMKQLRNTQKLSEESEEGELDEGIGKTALGVGVGAVGAGLLALSKARKVYKNLRKRSSKISADFYGGGTQRGWNGWEAWKKSKEQPKKTN